MPPLFLPCDITDIAALRRAIATVGDRLGNIGVLLNNAANDERHATLEVTPDYWDQRVAVNQRPQFFAAQAVIRSEERRVGKEGVSTCRSRWSPYHSKKKNKKKSVQKN